MQNFNPSLYDVLGRIPRHSTLQEIKIAYRTFAKLYHPDKNPNDKFTAEEKMRELNEAYEILSDPKKREAYNEKLLLRDENLRRQEEERKRKEDAERKRKQMEEEANKKPKFDFKFQEEKSMIRKPERNDTGALVGVGLALAGLALLIAALPDND
jgi:curved DNA-binding protein CbpA